MRLTCPRCNAQYEIPDAAIPAMGREVECSACAHVWHQPKGGPAQIASKSGAIAVDAADAGGDYDAQARPALNRQLNDSILQVLREETARELAARQAGPGASADSSDHIPATDAPQPDAPATAATDLPAPQPADEPPQTEAPAQHLIATPPETASDWPVSTVILPGEPLDAEALARADAKAEADAEAAAEAQAQAETSAAPAQTETPPLPDAARLAATLTRPAAPVLKAADMVNRPIPVETLTAPEPAPAKPAPTKSAAPAEPRRTRSGYAMGFGLAVMLALGLLALYALAPRMAAEDGGGALSGLRHSLDQTRLWLHGLIFGG